MNPKEIPTEEEFNLWKSLQVTKAVDLLLEKWETILKDQWAEGIFQNEESSVRTLTSNAAALAELAALRKIRGMNYDQFKLGLEDDDQ